MIEQLESRSFLSSVPQFSHIGVVVEENHAASKIVGNTSAPYITSLANSNAYFTQSFGVTHPSEPNYLALFSGSTQGVHDDGKHTFSKDNLGQQLASAKKKFVGYAESPKVNKHDPWESFKSSSTMGQDFSKFPSDYTKLPDVFFVVPNQQDDMHDGSVSKGDSWLKSKIDGYAKWAKTHNSLLIVTFDEDDHSDNNHISTIFVGDHVVTGKYSNKINHYNVLSTIEESYGLKHLNSASPITACWKVSNPPTTLPSGGGEDTLPTDGGGDTLPGGGGQDTLPTGGGGYNGWMHR